MSDDVGEGEGEGERGEATGVAGVRGDPAGAAGERDGAGTTGDAMHDGAQPGIHWAIRVAGPADLDAIMALETSTFDTDAWSPAMMRSDLAHEHCYYLVAENPAQPGPGRTAVPLGGYAGLLSPRGAADADIQTIAVAPDARRHGLGRTLMRELIAEAVRRGARRVFLEVRADNPGAQHLYETLGFIGIGIRRGYYQPDNVDAVVMRLELDTQKGIS